MQFKDFKKSLQGNYEGKESVILETDFILVHSIFFLLSFLEPIQHYSVIFKLVCGVCWQVDFLSWAYFN